MIKLALEKLTANEFELASDVSAILDRHEMKFRTREEKIGMVIDLVATLMEENNG